MKLDIFGERYRVLKCKGELPLPEAAAVCDVENKLIIISAELVGNEYMQVLLHEMLHAVIHRISLNQANISHDLQEILCDSFATALIENFKIVSRK